MLWQIQNWRLLVPEPHASGYGCYLWHFSVKLGISEKFQRKGEEERMVLLPFVSTWVNRKGPLSLSPGSKKGGSSLLECSHCKLLQCQGSVSPSCCVHCSPGPPAACAHSGNTRALRSGHRVKYSFFFLSFVSFSSLCLCVGSRWQGEI